MRVYTVAEKNLNHLELRTTSNRRSYYLASALCCCHFRHCQLLFPPLCSKALGGGMPVTTRAGVLPKRQLKQQYRGVFPSHPRVAAEAQP